VEIVWDVLTLGCNGVIVAVVCLMAYFITAAIYYQCIVGPAIQRDLGFTEGTAYLEVGRGLHSAVAVTTVEPHGVFDRAGFQVGDVLPGLSHTGLFRLLHRSRGRVAELTVVNGGSGPAFGDRPARVIRFTVPPKGFTDSAETGCS
jgi:hypothetical protein